jgi:hypothetical protein
VTKTLPVLMALFALTDLSIADTLDTALAKVLQRGWPDVAVLVESANGNVRIATAGLAIIESNTPMSAATGFTCDECFVSRQTSIRQLASVPVRC